MKGKDWVRLLINFVFVFLLLSGCASPTPAPTPTLTSTPSPSPSPTHEPTLTPTPTPSPGDAVLEGDALLRISDFEGAIEAYERAIAIDESYGRAYSGLSQVYLWQEIRSDDALAHAQKGVDLAPDDPIAHAVLAQVHLWIDAPSEALESAQQAEELDPDSTFVQAMLVKAYLANNQFDLARQTAEKAYALDPEDAFVLSTLGRYYQATVDFGRAQAAYEQAVMLGPEFVGWQMELGNYWFHRDHYDDAVKNYEKILEQVPDYIPALLGLAYVELDRYAFSEAEEILNDVLEQTPEEPSGYIGIGYLYYKQGEYEEALAQYNQAIELDPQVYGVREAIGYVYLQQQECDLADRQFQELAASFPDWAGPLIGRGDAELCKGDVNKALAHFRDAIEVDPFSSNAQTELGYGYLYQERWEGSREAYLEALRISPSAAWAHGALGDWFWYQGLLEEAKAEFRLALHHNPYFPSVYLGQGKLLLIQEDMDGAQEAVEKAVALDPTDLSARKLLGIIHAYQGDVQSAIQVFEEVLEEDPEDAASHLHLGLALRDLGEYRRAREELETYLGIAGDTLTEDEVFLLDYLVEVLELDYTLTEERALEQLAEFSQFLFSQSWDMDVEDIEEEGLTLVVTIPVNQADLESGTFLEQGGSFAVFASLLVPRIDPPIDNGLLIRFTLWGEPLFSMRSTLLTLKQFSDTLIDEYEFFDRMEFDLADEAGQQVSINIIARDIADLRELDMDQSIPSETLDRDAVHDHLVDSIDEQVSDSFERDASVLTLLGVISSTLDLEEVWVDLQSEQVAGFYVPEEKIIYVVESDEESAMDQLVLAHECVHALQDQAFGLEALDDASLNDDQSLAYRALVEGDATLATILYMEETIPIMDQLDASSQAGGFDSEALEAAPDFISEISTFPYIKGLEFVMALYQRDGWDYVNQAYADLPKSTEHILHPQSYIDGEMPIDVSLLDFSSALSDEWQIIEENVLGELGIQLMLAEYLGPAAAMQAAEGWGGDRYTLLYNQNEDVYSLVVKTTWDDLEQSDEFWSLYRSYMDHRSEYSEVVKMMIGDLSERWWSGERDHVYISQDETSVTIVIGSDLVDVEEIVSLLQDQ
jgi:tetratricopeptide (TPR) repeat protein